MDVFGVLDLSGAAEGSQRRATVEGVGTDADTPAEGPARHLVDTVEVLLYLGRGKRERVRFVVEGGVGEALGSLHDAAPLVLHVGEGLGQKFGRGDEVGVEDNDKFSLRALEGVAQISRFFQVAFVLASDVLEPELSR